ncbi:MAG: SIS domain-containing protein [Candidatus Sulfotelmatobacter sp.]|jgi:glucosamine--fructose-6-phosphate aminotransferase (isomerizing)
MDEPRLLRDIKNQGQSLAHVLAYQFAEGYPALLEASALLRVAPKIIVTGMGASLYASLPLQYQLAAMGLNCLVADSSELLHYQQRLCADAVVVLVSRSGESGELTKLLPQIKKIASRTITVTNAPGSMLAAGADLVLIIGSLEDERMAIQSYTGTLLTLMLLASVVAGDLDQVRQEMSHVLATISTLLDGELEGPRFWDGFLDPACPIFLLGRGPSYASALAGGLLFNETAKHPAIGVTCGNFRHGSVELVDSNFRGLVFAPRGKTRELNLALAESLERFGGKILVIGPRDEEHGRSQFIDVPTSDRLAPLAEIIPVQFGALYLAKLKRLPIGELRYIAQVTRDEVAF